MRLNILAGMIDELEKIGASMRNAGYLQSRRGTRPIRVDTLMNRQAGSVEPTTEPSSDAHAPEAEQSPDAAVEQDHEAAGEMSVGKTAAIGEAAETAMQGFAGARPYVAGAMQAGLPAAAVGNLIGGRRAAIISGVVGAGLGVTNEGLKSWASKHKRTSVAKKLLEGRED